MSEDQLRAFLEKVESDSVMHEKLKEAETPQEAIKIAEAAGFLITEDDLQDEGELSLEELETAAGAGFFGKFFKSGFFERRKKPRPRRNQGRWGDLIGDQKKIANK